MAALDGVPRSMLLVLMYRRSSLGQQVGKMVREGFDSKRIGLKQLGPGTRKNSSRFGEIREAPPTDLPSVACLPRADGGMVLCDPAINERAFPPYG